MHLIDIWLQGIRVSDDLHIQPCHPREIHPEGKKNKTTGSFVLCHFQ